MVNMTCSISVPLNTMSSQLSLTIVKSHTSLYVYDTGANNTLRINFLHVKTHFQHACQNQFNFKTYGKRPSSALIKLLS